MKPWQNQIDELSKKLNTQIAYRDNKRTEYTVKISISLIFLLLFLGLAAHDAYKIYAVWGGPEGWLFSSFGDGFSTIVWLVLSFVAFLFYAVSKQGLDEANEQYGGTINSLSHQLNEYLKFQKEREEQDREYFERVAREEQEAKEKAEADAAVLEMLKETEPEPEPEIEEERDEEIDETPEVDFAETMVPFEDRNKHIYIAGRTQFGKSTLMMNLALKDIKEGHGICLIDNKEDMVPKLMSLIPDERLDDVILFEMNNPLPIHFMNATTSQEQSRLVSDIVQIFERMQPGWGSRMEAILRFVVKSLLIVGDKTFIDIYRALTDEEFIQEISKHPKIQDNPFLYKFWTKDIYSVLKSESHKGLVLTRLTDFVLSDELQTVLGTLGAKLDLEKVIEERKILLVPLDGEWDVARLCGSIIASKIQQAVFRRKKKYPPFMLYIDEFQDYKSSGFEELIAKAGGLGVYLCLANQYLSQISEERVQTAIKEGIATFFLFQSDKTAYELKNQILDEPPDTTEYEESIQNFKTLKKEVARAQEDSRQFHIRFENFKDRMIRKYKFPSDTYLATGNDLDEYDKKEFERLEEDNQDAGHYFQKLYRESKELEENLPAAPDPYVSLMKQIPSLDVGQCVYRAANGSTRLIHTPPPLTIPHNSNAARIRQRTIAEYGPNRITSDASCNSTTITQDKGDEQPSEPQNVAEQSELPPYQG